MATIIKFPSHGDTFKGAPVRDPSKPGGVIKSKAAAVIAGLWRFVWVLFVLLWPIVGWVFSIEVFFQFLRMLYYWNTPAIHAGWTFLIHFSALAVLTYMVGFYRPKGF